MSALGDRIGRIIKKSALPLHLFATRLGVGRNTVVRYRDGDTSPTFDFLERMADEFRVDRKWLMLGEGELNEVPNASPDPSPLDLMKFSEFIEGYTSATNALRDQFKQFMDKAAALAPQATLEALKPK
jgi:transcriptional regulator with XRE-family HTH domain